MNLLKISFSILLVLLIAGCATISKSNFSEKEKLLIEHLESWTEFQANGIVTANYKNFVFRKNINIKKNSNFMKITVYDSGIFGLKPEPFMTVKIDSLIYIKAMGAEAYNVYQFPEINILLGPMQLLKYKDQIIIEESFSYDENNLILFSEDMKINKFKQISQGYSIEFFYETGLSGIKVSQNNIELIKIEIDKITYNRNKK